MAKGTGKYVFVSNSIRDIHPGSPLAGQRLEVAELDYKQKLVNLSLAFWEGNDKILNTTPVLWGNRVWYVENQYIVK